MIKLISYLVVLLFIIVVSALGGLVGFIISLVIVANLNNFMVKKKPHTPYIRPTTKTIWPEPIPDAPTHMELPVSSTRLDPTESIRDQEKRLYEQTSMISVPVYLRHEYREYLQSPEWNRLRKSTLKRDGYRCTHCGYIGPLQVHHTIYTGIFEMSFTEDQLISLCNDCHAAEHKRLNTLKD